MYLFIYTISSFPPICLCQGNSRCCKILLEHDAYPTPVTSSGITPGHFAAEQGHLKILQLLFYYGADLKAEDCSRERPVDLARKYNHMKCVEFLTRIEDFDEESFLDDTSTDDGVEFV